MQVAGSYSHKGGSWGQLEAGKKGTPNTGREKGNNQQRGTFRIPKEDTPHTTIRSHKSTSLTFT